MNNYLNIAKCVSHLNSIKSEDKNKRDKSINKLYELFTRKKGLYLKLGQFLNQHKSQVDYQDKTSMLINELDEESQALLNLKLQQLKLEKISEDVILGSIGFVIKCKDSLNNTCALKLQYPRIENNIKSQFTAIEKMLLVAPRNIKQQINSSGFFSSIQEDITNELDYTRELRNYKKMEKKCSIHVSVPKILKGGNDFILLPWVEGETIGQLAKQSKEVRENISVRLMSNFHHSLFNEGFIQVDNQEDNYIFSCFDNRLTAIDLGNCIEVTKEQRVALYYIITGLQEKKDYCLIFLLEKIGFSRDKLVHIEKLLAPLMLAIVAPYIMPMKYDLKNYDLSSTVEKILGENKWWFRMAGNNEVFSLMRSFSLLIKTLSRLDTPIFFKRLLEDDLTDNFLDSVKEMEVPHSSSSLFFKNMANNLIINVLEDGEEKVHLTFPVGVLMNIEEYISEEIKEKIIDKKIDITSLITKAYEDELRPQSILTIVDNNKEIEIKLV